MRIIGEVWPLIGFVLLGISTRPGHNAAPLSDGSSPNSNNGQQKYELVSPVIVDRKKIIFFY